MKRCNQRIGFMKRLITLKSALLLAMVFVSFAAAFGWTARPSRAQSLRLLVRHAARITSPLSDGL